MPLVYVTEFLSDNIAETPEGYLLCQNVPITRTGEFLYKGNELLGEDSMPLVKPSSDGIVRILRNENNVFDEGTIRSFEGKPFTLDHPGGFVDPENWQELTHGIVHNVRRGNDNQHDLLLADILVTTEDAIKLIKAGQRELSCGYDAEYQDLGSGIGEQTNIIGNHVALVSKGRAGTRCAIQDKACTNCGNCNCHKEKTQEETEVGKLTLKEKIKKWFDSCPIKDADEVTEEELKDEKEKVGGTTDEEEKEDEKKQEETEDEDEDEEKETKDGDGDPRIDELESRLGRIESLLKELLSEDNETADKKTKDEDSDEEDEKEQEEKETEDEEESDEEKEKKEVNDAWPDFLADLEILSPGYKVRKPTRDHLKTFDNMMVNVLEGAIENNEFGEQVELLAGKKGFHKMTHDALVTAFGAASRLAANKRNSKVQTKAAKTNDFAAARTVADINKRNKEYWKTKK